MSNASPRDEAAGSVKYEDVDDIIGIAAEMKNAEADHLTVADLKNVGAQLDIPEAYVERAVSVLESRRRAAAEGARRRRKAMLVGALAAAGLAVVSSVVGIQGASGVRQEFARVEQKRAQVRNVLDRQQHIEARNRDVPPGPGRDAELEGAENRVSVERRRYDEAAAMYNARTGGFPGSVFARFAGLATRAPLSNEVSRW